MIEWVAGAKIIAELLGTSIALIQGGREILKLVNAARGSAVGYVYVVQEVGYSKKFLIGRSLGKVDWLSELGKQIPGKLEPILIIPTENTRKLERELYRLYASNRTDGEWLDLTQPQVTEVRQLQIIVDRAIGNNVNPTLELDSDAKDQAKRLFELLSNASSGTEFRQETGSTQDPSPDWELRNVPIINYRDLEKLKRHAGYLMVVRDAEKKEYRIEDTKYPAKYIAEALGLVSLSYGLELALALESSRIDEVTQYLSILYPSNNEGGWTHLSPTQLQEIRNLASPELVHSSIYVTPKSHWGLETVQTGDYKELPRLQYPAGYVCITQGVKPGKLHKIWRRRKPKDLAGDLRLALMLNNPHDVHTASEPIQFRCIIKADHAESFETFLHERYAAQRTGGDWFKLTDAQLQEIRSMGE